MNNKGSAFYYTLMIGILVLVIALAFAGPLKSMVDRARGNTTNIETNSTTYSINTTEEDIDITYNSDFDLGLATWWPGLQLKPTVNLTLITVTKTPLSDATYCAIANDSQFPYILETDINISGNGTFVGNDCDILFEGEPVNLNAGTLYRVGVWNRTNGVDGDFHIALENPMAGTYPYLSTNGLINVTSGVNTGGNSLNSLTWYLIDNFTVSKTETIVTYGNITTIGLDCSNSSISTYDKGACMVADLTIFHFIGGLIFIAGAVLTAKLIFQ